MTREERHAIGEIITGNIQHTVDEMLERIELIFQEAISAERETCAQVAETTKHDRMAGLLSDQIAAAIRARAKP